MYNNNHAFPTELAAADGTIVRLCPLDLTQGKPVYCSHKGDFYTYFHNQLRVRKPDIVLHYNRNTCHTRYPKIGRHLGNKNLHVLMALTWIGPRPFVVSPDGTTIPMEVDHLNGNILDWRADNLDYVTPEENHKRARLLRVLRNIGRDPQQMSREELLEIFSSEAAINAGTINKEK